MMAEQKKPSTKKKQKPFSSEIRAKVPVLITINIVLRREPPLRDKKAIQH